MSDRTSAWRNRDLLLGLASPPPQAKPAEPPPQSRFARVGLRRPLHGTASEVVTLLSLLCFRRGVWGHSSRCFAFEGVSPLLSSAAAVQIGSTPQLLLGLASPPPQAKPAEPPLNLAYARVCPPGARPSVPGVSASVADTPGRYRRMHV